ncbi:MSMEG_4193 family putative phosphomutase [Actinomadura graeca]|uniref:MSMEG_4193 family putative phosphomutase n=1 Tax=Actinomadura graeca TaxID=2750812 RepID=A0ABX8QMF7_9ACTN|nr:MSMEG_4193 family putative phosphomutase [Actinomadura graeca]QXJ19910.1 MSMEG_4193 family putative phosphomutase [Actinomadura graeca]
MTTLLLLRHGLTAMTGPALAGWTPGVHLDERGRAQVSALARRLEPVPLAAIVSSPLERCVETADAVAAGRPGPAGKVETDDRFGEVRYGDWTGRPLRELAEEPLWRVVQAHPSAVRFPGPDGEALAAAQHRAVAAVREWNARIAAEHGDDAVYAVCSHGDIIKAVVADALGLHLDQFQRIHADPASLTAVRYTELRPFVVRLNDTGGDVGDLLPKPPGDGGSGSSDAPVGGGA